MKSLMLTFLINVLLMIPGFGQDVKGIGKTYAFYKQKTQGNIMANDHDQPILALPLLERIIYVEAKGEEKPTIQSVIYKGVTFSPSLFVVDSFNIGRSKMDGRAIKLPPSKGYKLWKIELHPVDKSIDTVNKAKFPKGIFIIGESNKKQFSIKVLKEEELLTEEVY
jgi:hypothetical protein